jgi:hypothetical protein
MASRRHNALGEANLPQGIAEFRLLYRAMTPVPRHDARSGGSFSSCEGYAGLPRGSRSFDRDFNFVAEGLSREPWRTGAPIRRIFCASFAAAGLVYANPHTFRDTRIGHGANRNFQRAVDHRGLAKARRISACRC